MNRIKDREPSISQKFPTHTHIYTFKTYLVLHSYNYLQRYNGLRSFNMIKWESDVIFPWTEGQGNLDPIKHVLQDTRKLTTIRDWTVGQSNP